MQPEHSRATDPGTARLERLTNPTDRPESALPPAPPLALCFPSLAIALAGMVEVAEPRRRSWPPKMQMRKNRQERHEQVASET